MSLSLHLSSIQFTFNTLNIIPGFHITLLDILSLGEKPVRWNAVPA